MKKYFLLSLFIALFIVLGCAGVLNVANCDTTPVKSSLPKCAEVTYPANAMDPCAPAGDSWEAVNTLQATNGLVFQFLYNTEKDAKITHVFGVFAGQSLPVAVAYVEEGQIRLLKLKLPSEYVWEPDMTEKRYQALKEIFFIGFPKDKAPVIEPMKQRC